MGAVSCMKHLGLLGIHIIVIRSGDGVLVTIPKRIQKFIMAAGAGFIPLPDRCLKRSVCRQVTVIRKQLAIRVVQQRSRTQREKLEPSRPSVRDKLKQELPAHKSAAPKKREPER